MRHPADDGVKHGGEGHVFAELADAVAAGLDQDDEGEGLAAGVLFEVEDLGYAVVGEGEVVCFEREDELAGLVAHQRRHHDQGGAGGDGGGGRGGGLRGGQTSAGGEPRKTAKRQCCGLQVHAGALTARVYRSHPRCHAAT